MCLILTAALTGGSSIVLSTLILLARLGDDLSDDFGLGTSTMQIEVCYLRLKIRAENKSSTLSFKFFVLKLEISQNKTLFFLDIKP